MTKNGSKSSSSSNSDQDNAQTAGKSSSSDKSSGDSQLNSQSGGNSAQLLSESVPDAGLAKLTTKRRRGGKGKGQATSSSTSAATSGSTASSSGSAGTDNGASDSADSSSSAGQKSAAAGHVIPGAVLLSADGSTDGSGGSFGEKFDSSKWQERSSKNDQGNVWKELDSLRGKEKMSAGEIQDLLAKSAPGKDYPTYGSIPTTSFSCENVNQAGFYADPETRWDLIKRVNVAEQ